MGRKPGNARKQARIAKSQSLLPAKKDRRVLKSSHGKFPTVAKLEAHRLWQAAHHVVN